MVIQSHVYIWPHKTMHASHTEIHIHMHVYFSTISKCGILDCLNLVKYSDPNILFVPLYCLIPLHFAIVFMIF